MHRRSTRSTTIVVIWLRRCRRFTDILIIIFVESSVDARRNFACTPTNNGGKRTTIVVTDIVVTYIVCLVISMPLTYIATIRGKMRKLTLENFTLINQIDEGLVVIHKEN